MGRPNLVPIFTATNEHLTNAKGSLDFAYDAITNGVDAKQLSPGGIADNINTARVNVNDAIKTLEKLIEQLS